jgi:thiol-disulfide isomerase/thioredoxin
VVTPPLVLKDGAISQPQQTELAEGGKATLAFLQQRYAEADATYEREVRALTDAPDGRARAEELRRKRDAVHAGQFLAAIKLAEANPRSETGFSALEWVLKIVRSYYLPAGPRALALVNEQYAQEPEIGSMLATLTGFFPYPKNACYPGALDLLHAVVAKNPDRMARGHAVLGLAWLAKREFEEAEYRGDPAELARITAQTEKAFESVIRDYGDCPFLQEGATARPTLRSVAESELHEIRHLSIGQVAPEIEGMDLDSVPMRLSDSRGKIVLLVFWASWCGPCMAAVPHEKELVERFKGRPFVLIGVNGDDTPHLGAKAVKKNQIPWRSFWNGEGGARGSIASDWNVRGWPTVYVLDQHGTIRQKYLGGKPLDDLLENLVTAAEARVH